MGFGLVAAQSRKDSAARRLLIWYVFFTRLSFSCQKFPRAYKLWGRVVNFLRSSGHPRTPKIVPAPPPTTPCHQHPAPKSPSPSTLSRPSPAHPTFPHVPLVREQNLCLIPPQTKPPSSSLRPAEPPLLPRSTARPASAFPSVRRLIKSCPCARPAFAIG